MKAQQIVLIVLVFNVIIFFKLWQMIDPLKQQYLRGRYVGAWEGVSDQDEGVSDQDGGNAGSA